MYSAIVVTDQGLIQDGDDQVLWPIADTRHGPFSWSEVSEQYPEYAPHIVVDCTVTDAQLTAISGDDDCIVVSSQEL